MRAHPVLLRTALVVLALGLAGCAQTPSAETPAATTSPPARSPAASPAGAPTPGASDCLQQPPPDPDRHDPRTPLGPVDPVAFVECGVGLERIRGKGEWRVRYERRVVGDVSALAAALRLPDQPQPAGVICAAIGVPGPGPLRAVDAQGHARLVRIPRQGCGWPRSGVMPVYDALRWKTVHRELLTQVTPQAVFDLGCGARAKDTAGLPAGRARPSLPLRPGPASVCVYAFDVDPGQDGLLPEGAFTSGRRLAAVQWRLVQQLIRTAPPAPAGCTAPPGRFATLGNGRAENVVVELDGCRRVYDPTVGVRLATPRLLQEVSPS